jgi:hypothetical protein
MLTLKLCILQGLLEDVKQEVDPSLVWLGDFKQGVYQPEFALLKK